MLHLIKIPKVKNKEKQLIWALNGVPLVSSLWHNACVAITRSHFRCRLSGIQRTRKIIKIKRCEVLKIDSILNVNWRHVHIFQLALALFPTTNT